LLGDNPRELNGCSSAWDLLTTLGGKDRVNCLGESLKVASMTKLPCGQSASLHIHQEMILSRAWKNHVTIKDRGHFLQEDKGEELAEVMVQFINDNNLAVSNV
jgi:hypothetical protein